MGDETVAVEDLNDGVGDKRFVVYDEDSDGRGRASAAAVREGCWSGQSFAFVVGRKSVVHGGPGLFANRWLEFSGLGMPNTKLGGKFYR
jgi:hypothetical protein